MWGGEGVYGKMADWMEESLWSWREATGVKCNKAWTISKTVEYHIQKARRNLTRTECCRKKKKSTYYKRWQYKNRH